jgi:biotin carboxyl carrier protein
VTVAAPMPGRVVAIPVSVGDEVQRGQTVVVLEAMKMESSLATPHPGKVVEVLVSPGQTVQQRQALVRIDGEAG